MVKEKYILNTREMQEKAEKNALAPYALFCCDSKGRDHPEPPHKFRTCFQRDRERIIHSAAFRRLEAKTQVFFAVSQDYYRTRLTHTIEVAQIARSLSRALRLNEDLAEAVSLAHDLGHPPYGHWGQTVLNELMAEHGGFEHNRQSLRIVEYLEHPYPAFPGLNLTYETRLCLALHETIFDHSEPDLRYGKGLAPLEGQIADLADSIAYNSHDLDDSLAYGLIQEQDLIGLELYQTLKKQVEDQYPLAHRFARQLRCAKALIDFLILDVLEETARRLARFSPRDAQAVCQLPAKIVALSPSCREKLDKLQDFLAERVYQHPRLLRHQRQVRRQLEFLFDAYSKKPRLLPERYQARLDEQGQYRVVCDYLAGMTDRYCNKLYRKYIRGGG